MKIKILYSFSKKNFLYLILDSVLIFFSFSLAFLLRFYPELQANIKFFSFIYFILAWISFIFAFYFFQIYRIIWAYSNIADIYKVIYANLVGFLFFLGFILFLSLPYSRIVIMTFFMFNTAFSVFYKILLRDYYLKKRGRNFLEVDEQKMTMAGEEKKILIIGAGETGRIILGEYRRAGLEKMIVGFIDDDRNKIGKMLNGKLVYSRINQIDQIIKKFRVTEVFLAMPSLGMGEVEKIVSEIRQHHKTIRIKILPPLVELIKDKPLSFSLREVGIMDLIGREEFKIEADKIKEKFLGKVILITGAGGSIGSEICRQILRFKIKKIIAVGRGEFAIYNLIKSLEEYRQFMDFSP